MAPGEMWSSRAGSTSPRALRSTRHLGLRPLQVIATLIMSCQFCSYISQPSAPPFFAHFPLHSRNDGLVRSEFSLTSSVPLIAHDRSPLPPSPLPGKWRPGWPSLVLGPLYNVGPCGVFVRSPPTQSPVPLIARCLIRQSPLLLLKYLDDPPEWSPSISSVRARVLRSRAVVPGWPCDCLLPSSQCARDPSEADAASQRCRLRCSPFVCVLSSCKVPLHPPTHSTSPHSPLTQAYPHGPPIWRVSRPCRPGAPKQLLAPTVRICSIFNLPLRVFL
jgi:hypothetical protein